VAAAGFSPTEKGDQPARKIAISPPIRLSSEVPSGLHQDVALARAQRLRQTVLARALATRQHDVMIPMPPTSSEWRPMPPRKMVARR